MGLVALRHVGSSWIRDQTHVCCISRQILYHLATKENPQVPLSVGFPLSPHWNLCPRVGECWSKGANASYQLVSAIAEVQAFCATLPVQAPASVSLSSVAAWGPSILHPSQSVTASSLHHSPFHCGATPQGRQGPTWALSTYWGMSWGGRAALRALGCFWCTAWVSTNHGHCHPTRLALGLGSLWIPKLCLLLSNSCPRSNTTPWYEEWMGLEYSLDWAWDMHQGGCGKPSGHLTTSFCPSWGQASVHVLLRSRIQASHSSPTSSSGPPASQGGASYRTGVPNPQLSLVSPQVSANEFSLFLWVSPRSKDPNSISFLSFLPDYMYIFLIVWLYRSPSANF